MKNNQKQFRASFFVIYLAEILVFNRDLNRSCLVYVFSLHFSVRKFLINLRRQFPVRKVFLVRKIFRTHVFARFAVFILCLKLVFRK